MSDYLLKRRSFREFERKTEAIAFFYQEAMGFLSRLMGSPRVRDCTQDKYGPKLVLIFWALYHTDIPHTNKTSVGVYLQI